MNATLAELISWKSSEYVANKSQKSVRNATKFALGSLAFHFRSIVLELKGKLGKIEPIIEVSRNRERNAVSEDIELGRQLKAEKDEGGIYLGSISED